MTNTNERRPAPSWSEIEGGLDVYLQREAAINRVLSLIREAPMGDTVEDFVDHMLEVRELVLQLDGIEE